MQEADKASMGKYVATWPPLTSDPELLNDLMYGSGMARDFALQDILDIEVDLCDAVALIIIYPESDDDERRKASEEEPRTHIDSKSIGIRSFIKQNIDNACGLIAVINAILNSAARDSISKHISFLRINTPNNNY